jgi:hypothetical protein
MCIAIWNPASAPDIKRDTMLCCRDENPHGMGMAWVEDSRVRVVKQMGRFRKFYKRYISVRKKGYDVMLHFRIATSGVTDINNCHPFIVKERGIVACHNGILPMLGNKEVSDTRQFLDILADLPFDWWKSSSITPLLQLATHGSKFIFLRADGDVWLLNEQFGHWFEGTWWSNTSYLPPPPIPVRYKPYEYQRDVNRTWGQEYFDDMYSPVSVDEAQPRSKSILSSSASIALMLGSDVYCVDCVPHSQQAFVQVARFDHPVMCASCGQVANEDDYDDILQYCDR